MKITTVRKLSETLAALITEKKISAKELAKKAGISYSSLVPILNGSRECGISKLSALADALETTPDILLNGFFQSKKNSKRSSQKSELNKPGYLAVFISFMKVTYCTIYEINSGNIVSAIVSSPLSCSEEVNTFLDHLILAIQKLTKKFASSIDSVDSVESIELNEIGVFVAVQQYNQVTNRKRIQSNGNALFAKFILGSDAVTNQNAFFSNQAGICVSINDGDTMTYRIEQGKIIKHVQGYGFPISDVAGNYWLGCEAIKHTIRVKEGLEESSSLSDRLLVLFNDDVDILSENATANPNETYLMASSLVKELMHQPEASYVIVKKSAQLLLEDIAAIDEKTKTRLPIILAGELAYLYAPFFPEDRLIKTELKQQDILSRYGIELLKASMT